MINETLNAINSITDILNNIIDFILNIIHLIVEIPIMIAVALTYPLYVAFYYSTTIIQITINVLSAFVNSFHMMFDKTLLIFNQLLNIFPPAIMFLLGVILLSIVILRILKLLPTFD